MNFLNRIMTLSLSAKILLPSAALDSFDQVEAECKIALLGDMRELGDDSVKEHEKIVCRLAAAGIESYLVGEEFSKALASTGLHVAGWFADSEALATWLKANPVSDAVVLVKGSRGIQMEKALPEL